MSLIFALLIVAVWLVIAGLAVWAYRLWLGGRW